MRILREELEIAKIEEESARTKQAANQETALARNGIQLKPTQSHEVPKRLQPCKGPQKRNRTFKASSTSTKPVTGTELRGQGARSQKDKSGMTSKESRLKSNKELCFGQINSKSTVGSHWRSSQKGVESSSIM